MTQDERDGFIELAKQVGMIRDGEVWFSPSYENCDVYTADLLFFAKLIADKEREACAIECEKIALGFTKWPDSFEGATAETKLMRSLGEFVHKPFTEAIRARGQA